MVRSETAELHNLAVSHYKGGQFDRALTALDDVLGKWPDSGLSWYLRGVILEESGRPEEAVGALDQAIALGVNLPKAHYHRGVASFLAGRKDEALKDLERAVQAVPEFAFAHYNLGVVAVAKRAWKRAREAFTRCLELDPANRDEYLELLYEIGRGEAQEEAYAQAHRLKNLIGVVGDEYRSLLQELRQALGVRALAPRAEKIADELAHLYRDLAKFCQAVELEPRSVDLIDLRDVVDRALFALSPRLRGIDVVKRYGDDVPEIIGESRSLGEVISNVLTNALEACGKGGKIQIDVAGIQALADDPGAEAVRVVVEDSGPGIAPEQFPRIFEFGYTTKRFGSGIGLAFSDRVVRAHGGRIEIGSEPGRGAKVTVTLPSSPTTAPTSLRNLRLRSVLFEDLRELVVRGAEGEDLEMAPHAPADV